MTIEEMMAKMKELNAKQQEQYISKLADMVDVLCDKANKRDYEPTNKEREIFEHIRKVINNMANWF